MMSHSQIEESYKHPRHRRFPSERFQEEEPVQTGKFEVNQICSFGFKSRAQCSQSIRQNYFHGSRTELCKGKI